MHEGMNLVSAENEEQFMQQQMDRYKQLLLQVQQIFSCSRGKAKRIIEARSRKIIKQYNKSVAKNQNKPKIHI